MSIPAKVIAINEDMATVSVGGTIYNASLQIVENVDIGDYVLIHTGFVIQKLSAEEAQETLSLFSELIAIDREIEKAERRETKSEERMAKSEWREARKKRRNK
ncbi:MAG: HypC/HybG/HupF family hydrogenase formation chaperone [Bacteroidetes bacterium]|nr:HypC/HybG/HupF family hydrogenase formation chaperone [Bacteroidota bacterium]